LLTLANMALHAMDKFRKEEMLTHCQGGKRKLFTKCF